MNNAQSPLPAYLKRRGSDETYVGTTTSGDAAGTFVVEYGQFVLEDLAAHEIWVPLADGEAVARDEADAVVANHWAKARPLDYGCHRMVTGRGLPRWPLRWFADNEHEDGEASPVELVEYVSFRFVPYVGQWSEADPEDVAGTLIDGRAERATSSAGESPDLEIRLPLPVTMYAALAECVRTGTAPVTGAVILSMARLLPADPTDPRKGGPAGFGETIVLATAPGEFETTLVSLSLHGPGALSPHMASAFWLADTPGDQESPNY